MSATGSRRPLTFRRPACLFAALFVAVGGCSHGTPNATASAPSAGPWPPEQLAQSGWQGVPLVMGKGRLFEVEAEVQGEKLILLLDCGASQTTIDTRVAERLKLPLTKAPWSAGGLGTSGATTWITQLPTLKLGPFTTAWAESWVMDLAAVNASRAAVGDRPADGLIGAALLDFHFGVIDYPRRTLYLRPRPRE